MRCVKSTDSSTGFEFVVQLLLLISILLHCHLLRSCSAGSDNMIGIVSKWFGYLQV